MAPTILIPLCAHSLRHTPFTPPLNISNSTLQRTRQINMKQRSRQPMHNRHPMIPRICLTRTKFPTQILTNVTSTARTSRIMAGNRIILIRARLFDIPGSLPLEFLRILTVFGCSGGAILAANLSDAENRFPACETRLALRCWVAESGGCECAFCPAVVDAGEMPIYFVRGGVAVKLVADVEKVLDRCDVDVVDGRKVEDDSFESRFMRFVCRGAATAWTWVVPGTILWDCKYRIIVED